MVDCIKNKSTNDLNPPTIVVVGGLWSGVSVVRLILQQSHPAKVILVSALEQAYNNTAAPRLFVKPELVAQTVVDLRLLEKRKGKHEFELVVGTATKLDVANNELTVDTQLEPIKYDYIVLATGQRSEIHAFKPHGDVRKLVDSVNEISKAIKQAQSICIVGGGATGVEVTGEIAKAYPKKLVTLITGDKDGPLKPFGAKTSQAAEKRLNDLKVTVINKMGEVNGNKVTFKDDESKLKIFDLVIPTFGYTPNTSFIPKQYLDDKDYVNVDDHFKVKGTDNVFATGDCALTTAKSAADINLVQLLVIQNTIKREMFGENISPKQYQTAPLTSLVPVGPDGGVGKLWGWRVPSIFVWYAKGKDFMIPKTESLLT